RIRPAEVRDRHGDKLPSARGVGPKGAADLLKRYGTLDGILAAGLFPSQANDLRLFRSIATMNRKAPLPSLATQSPTWTKAADLAAPWGLTRPAARMGALQPPPRPSSSPPAVRSSRRRRARPRPDCRFRCRRSGRQRQVVGAGRSVGKAISEE